MIDERKNIQTTPIRTYCKRSRPLPYSSPNKQDAPATGSLPSTIAPPYHPVLIYHFSLLSPSLWETAQYRLKYCLKGSLNPNQPTNQPTIKSQRMTSYTYEGNCIYQTFGKLSRPSMKLSMKLCPCIFSYLILT